MNIICYIYEQKTCVQDCGYEMMIGSCVFFAIESSIFFTFLHGVLKFMILHSCEISRNFQ